MTIAVDLGRKATKPTNQQQANTKTNFEYIVCRDNYHHLLKYFFGTCLCSILIPLLHVSNLLQNGHFPIFSLFWRPFLLP